MNGFMKAVLALVFFSLFIAAPSIWATWIWDGVPICVSYPGEQFFPKIVSDGAGGAIVTWEDHRSGDFTEIYADVYAQRVRASGTADWTLDGVPLCTAAEGQVSPEIVSDGAGGAIVTWVDHRSGNWDIYARRVNSEGTVLWAVNGNAICTATGDQVAPGIVSDGAGGAIITWEDSRSGNKDIYAQRVNAVGEYLWTANGVALCVAPSDQEYAEIVSDGAGGAIIAWDDSRSAISIYAQRVDASGVVRWTANGVVLCSALGLPDQPAMTSDGEGGAIVAWRDSRQMGEHDIYAQKVSRFGTPAWTSNGIALCRAIYDQDYPDIISDGAGGAIVIWEDYRSGTNYDIYAQRVSRKGDTVWTSDGVALCAATGDQEQSTIAPDGAGGVIVTWVDYRTLRDIFAQRVSASGAVQWHADGVPVCSASGNQLYPTITSDGAGGAIVAWNDGRTDHGDIFAQCIDRLGRPGQFAPDILSVQDIPGDQGGWVRISVATSSLGEETAIYNIWQRIDDAAMLAMISRSNGDGAADASPSEVPLKHPVDASSVSGWPVREFEGRQFLHSREILGATEFQFPPGTWELLGSFAACDQGQYIYRASTLSDSTGSGIPYSVYVVSEQWMTPVRWFVSDPDSGYSVDNLPPDPPEGLVAEQSFVPAGLALDWNVNAANDLSHYAVYRGTSEDFEPAAGNRVAAPLAPEFFDGTWRWDGGFYYKISALDVHGNESGFALLRPEDVTGSETPKAPEATYLKQNYPNPFNPMTKIAYGLAAPERVSLRIYDAAGRLVRELVNEVRPAARYEDVWDGRDGAGRQIASGMYFYRLDAGAFTQTKKMILLR